ncbi:hypothetical protein [Sulfuriferula thiophila]|uniref:hypothetical protein n=1 Tax=Sulfuriferula thiophila TaxID=1781211 RepID=UPI000F60573A|nr:hypothetical protein [Sulfuriferula thiophila]
MQTLPTPATPAKHATRLAKAKAILLTLWSVINVLSIALILFVFVFWLIIMFAPADWLPAAFTVIH